MTLFLLSMGWAICLLIFSLWLIPKRGRGAVPKNPYLILIIVALFVRILPGIVLVQDSNYDLESYSLVSDHVLAREDVYSSEDTINRHPYLPFAMYWMAFAKWVSNIFHCQFDAFVKLLPIAADAAISLVIYQYLLNKTSPNLAFFGGMIYAINPIAVIVSAYHGQFDALPGLLMMISIWQVDRSTNRSGWWLGLGVLAKSWPVLALPSLISEHKSIRGRLGFLIYFSLAPILGVILYLWIFHANFITVIRTALSYNHGLGVWGYTYLIRLLSILWPSWGASIYGFTIYYGRYITLAILIIVWFTTARKEKLEAGLLTIIVSFFAFTHAFAIQYLMWPVQLAIINQEYSWLRLYTIASFAYMFLVYNTMILNSNITNLLPLPLADLALIIPASFPVWLISVAWAISRMKNVYRIDLEKKELKALST